MWQINYDWLQIFILIRDKFSVNSCNDVLEIIQTRNELEFYRDVTRFK